MKRFFSLATVFFISISIFALISSTISTEASPPETVETATTITTAATVWRSDIADEATITGEYKGIFPAIALDNSGNPHIVHYQAPDGELRYTWWDGAQWTTQVVADGLFDSSENPGSMDLAVDDDGNAHIAYVDIVSHTLQYASSSGGSWNSQTIDSASECVSIEVDDSGNPHVGYCDNIDTILKYAFLAGSSWITQTVDPENQTLDPASMTLDSQGQPIFGYLVYNALGPTVELRFASWTGASWDIQVVDTVTSPGVSSLDIAIDSNDNPYIYYAPSPDVKLVRWDGANWTTEYIASIGNLYQYENPIVLDSLDQPHVLYMNTNGGQYARKEDGIWITEPLPVPGGLFDMAVDGNDDLHIGIFSNDELVHLKEVESTFQETIDPALGGSVVYTDTVGLATIVDIPAGAATDLFTVTLTPLITPTTPLAMNINRVAEVQNTTYAGRVFNVAIDVPATGDYFIYLPAIVSGADTAAGYEGAGMHSLQQAASTGYPLTKPITITIHYSDSDIEGLSEETLLLSNYDTASGAWVDASTTCASNSSYERNLPENWIRVAVCATGEFALSGQ